MVKKYLEYISSDHYSESIVRLVKSYCLADERLQFYMDTIGLPKESKFLSISRDKIGHTSYLGYP